MGESWIPKGHIAFVWPDGKIRLATERSVRERPEYYRQNGVKKYEGPEPQPITPVPTGEEPAIIVPDYLEADARRAAKVAAEEALDVDGDDEPDEEADGSEEES